MQMPPQTPETPSADAAPPHRTRNTLLPYWTAGCSGDSASRTRFRTAQRSANSPPLSHTAPPEGTAPWCAPRTVLPYTWWHSAASRWRRRIRFRWSCPPCWPAAFPQIPGKTPICRLSPCRTAGGNRCPSRTSRRRSSRWSPWHPTGTSHSTYARSYPLEPPVPPQAADRSICWLPLPRLHGLPSKYARWANRHRRPENDSPPPENNRTRPAPSQFPEGSFCGNCHGYACARHIPHSRWMPCRALPPQNASWYALWRTWSPPDMPIGSSHHFRHSCAAYSWWWKAFCAPYR